MLPETEKLANSLKESYGVPVIPVSVENMQERDMILLLELVDDLLMLNEAIKNLGGLGYQERFPKLDNVYEV